MQCDNSLLTVGYHGGDPSKMQLLELLFSLQLSLFPGMKVL